MGMQLHRVFALQNTGIPHLPYEVLFTAPSVLCWCWQAVGPGGYWALLWMASGFRSQDTCSTRTPKNYASRLSAPQMGPAWLSPPPVLCWSCSVAPYGRASCLIARNHILPVLTLFSESTEKYTQKSFFLLIVMFLSKKYLQMVIALFYKPWVLVFKSISSCVLLPLRHISGVQ